MRVLNGWGTTISKKQHSECVILGNEAFDPDAVFYDDIVEDDALPYLSLAVDGLTTSFDTSKGAMELRPEDVQQPDEDVPSTMPVANFNPEQLEVYGWESSLWRKIRGYLGF